MKEPNQPKMKIWHGHGKGRIDVALSFNLSPETTLRILCDGIHATDAFVAFVKKAKNDHPKSAEIFLDSFLSAITEALDLRDFYLAAKPDKVGGPLDFQRPSPSWQMLKRFLEGVVDEEVFRSVIERHATALPHYVTIRKRG